MPNITKPAGREASGRLRTELAKRIRTLRESYKWSQEDLAAACGLTQSHITKLEAGTVAPSWLTMRALVVGLDCDPKLLLCLPTGRRTYE